MNVVSNNFINQIVQTLSRVFHLLLDITYKIQKTEQNWNFSLLKFVLFLSIATQN